jgi:hypothetical protein
LVVKSDVLPSFAANNALDGAMRHTQAFGDGSPSYAKAKAECSDASNLICCQQSPAMTIAKRGLPALFAIHVLHVFGVGSKEKVTRVDARTDIAFVANAHSLWDWADVHLVRGTVCIDYAAAPSDVTVSVLAFASHPLPAAIAVWLLHLGHKSGQVFVVQLHAVSLQIRQKVDENAGPTQR